MLSNKKNKRITLTVIILVLALLLGACGGANGGSSKAVSFANEASMPAMAPTEAPAAADMGRMFDMAAEEDYELIQLEAEGGGFISGKNDSNAQSGRKITFSASMTLNTKSYDADYAKINDIIAQAGGYVSSESTTDYSGMYGRTTGRYSYFSVRIPAEGYDSFLDRVSSVCEVVEKNKWSDDLTTQYFDTEARIEMLEIRKERLMKYLVEAENAADIVEFERELSNVLYDLDYYQGNKRNLDRLVEHATVDIYLSELITPETIGKDGQPLGERASEAFGMSAVGVGRFLEGTVVFLAAAVPVIILLVVIAIIVLVILRLTRPLREKCRVKREEKKAQRPPKWAKAYRQTNVPPGGYQQPYTYSTPQPQEPQQAEQQTPPEQQKPTD